MQYYKLVLVFVLGMTLCSVRVDGVTEASNISSPEKAVNSSSQPEKQPYVSSLQTNFLPTDLSLKSGLGQALIFVGVAAFSFVLVGGLTLLFAPLFGYKICTILGNCDPVITPYNAVGTLQNPGQASNFPSADLYGLYSNGPYVGYQKRSLDYIKPIIETLASAYEKKTR